MKRMRRDILGRDVDGHREEGDDAEAGEIDDL
jgi:hypothetical protein